MQQQAFEGRIIFPSQDNHGRDLSTLLSELQETLTDAFGGVTWTMGRGSWKSGVTVYTEAVNSFTVAAPENPANNAVLRDIALRFAHRAEQLSVYVKDFSGVVNVLKTEERPAIAA